MASESASHAFMAHAKELVDAGQFGKAIEVLQQGLKKFPKMVSARVMLGEVYCTSGDLALARVELEQVIKAAPDNFAAFRKLAQVYHELGIRRWRSRPARPSCTPIPRTVRWAICSRNCRAAEPRRPTPRRPRTPRRDRKSVV